MENRLNLEYFDQVLEAAKEGCVSLAESLDSSIRRSAAI